MKKKCGAALTLTLGLLLLCAACRPGAPRGETVQGPAILGVLGLEETQGALDLYGMARGEARGEGKTVHGQGAALNQAIEAAELRAGESCSFAHVEHLVLQSAAQAWLPEVLAWAFSRWEQNTETALWLWEGELPALFDEDKDLPERLSSLKTLSRKGRLLPLCTLREAARARARGEGVLLPVLGAEKTLAGLGLWTEAGLLGVLRGEAACGAALLTGKPLSWTEDFLQGSVQVESRALSAEARWSGAQLTGLSLRLQLGFRCTDRWKDAENEALSAALCRRVEGQLRAALCTMQTLGAEGCGLCRRAGGADFLRWDALQEAWPTAFPQMNWQISVCAEEVGG